MGSVRVAIVGVGNCAASLVQGVEYYRTADADSRVPGLMHVQFGPYHVSDIEFVAAFDVDAKKVGRDISEAIVASENNTANRVHVGDSSGFHGALPLYFFLERYTDSYINEMKAFIHAVEKDETPPVVGLDGRIPVVIGLAAWKSVREGRSVKVSEIK